jgi:hypothetical protein
MMSNRLSTLASFFQTNKLDRFRRRRRRSALVKMTKLFSGDKRTNKISPSLHDRIFFFGAEACPATNNNNNTHRQTGKHQDGRKTETDVITTAGKDLWRE